MHLAISIVGAIVAIFIIVILHEMGHFFVARLFGIKVLRFSIGFGKALYKKTSKAGTEYVLAAIPLGGYVKMLGESAAASVSPHEVQHSYHGKPLLVRMAVVLAGPLTNFILALVVFWLTYLIGMDHVKPIVGRVLPGTFAAQAGFEPGDQIIQVNTKITHDWQQVIMALFASLGEQRKVAVLVKRNPPQSKVLAMDLSRWNIDQRNPQIFAMLGILPYFPPVPPVIARVLPNSPGAEVKLAKHDVIRSINGKPVTEWREVAEQVSQAPGKLLNLTIERHGKLREIAIKLGQQQRGTRQVGYLGVMVVVPHYPAAMIFTERYNPWRALVPAFSKTWDLLQYNVIVLAKMITAKLSFKTMGGPISIFQAAGQATQEGLEVYLSFIGFISLTVGFINLLPIPGLDGGHLLFQVIEGIIRRPVPEKIQHYGFTVGMLFVIFVIAHATINDLLRIFG